ncbi:hypothetical protein [Armatimonas sp.]|nr:hypothetical protein [Armatimonas sp.]
MTRQRTEPLVAFPERKRVFLNCQKVFTDAWIEAVRKAKWGK